MLNKGSDRYIWDIETDNLLDDVTVIHCLSISDGDTIELFTDADDNQRSIEIGLDILSSAEAWVGHNLIAFDWQVVKRLYPWVKPAGFIWDTLLMSRLVCPEIERLPISSHLSWKDRMSHSLRAWGIRLGSHKIDYQGGWDSYNSEMGLYCVGDTTLTAGVYQYLLTQAGDKVWDTTNLNSPIQCEYQFASNIARQHETGFYFNESAAQELIPVLTEEKHRILTELQEIFPPNVETIQMKTKVKTITTPFNPNSGVQVSRELQSRGWIPLEFTKSTKDKPPEQRIAKTDEKALSLCPLPEAAAIIRFQEVDKRLGQIANGDNAWMKLCRDGRVHGEVNTIGAVTSRVTHSRPNMSAVPRVGSYLGEECRALFGPRPGWMLVGSDLSGIELRCLAHYLWSFDDGEYADHVLNGDVHTVHQEAFGLPPGKHYRNIGKTGTYCLIYGGGDPRLGLSLGATGSVEDMAVVGKRARASLMSTLPALKALLTAIKTKKKANNGMIRAIDGRPLYCRSDHSALNTLLQSCGAIIAKNWYNNFHNEMNSLGYVYGEHYETHGFFHDEVQVGCRPEIADLVGSIFERCAVETGVNLGFKLPVNAEYSIGNNWEETH